MTAFHEQRARCLGGSVLLSLLIVALDCLAGPFSQLPLLYPVPVLLAARQDRRWGVVLALALPLCRLLLVTLWDVPWTSWEVGSNALICLTTLVVAVFLAGQTGAQASEVKALQGLLPICSFCKRIRDAGEEWQPLERYIMAHSSAAFTHSLCPECVQEHYGSLLDAAPCSAPHYLSRSNDKEGLAHTS